MDDRRSAILISERDLLEAVQVRGGSRLGPVDAGGDHVASGFVGTGVGDDDGKPVGISRPSSRAMPSLASSAT
jgi:hypothetical protein